MSLYDDDGQFDARTLPYPDACTLCGAIAPLFDGRCQDCIVELDAAERFRAERPDDCAWMDALQDALDDMSHEQPEPQSVRVVTLADTLAIARELGFTVGRPRHYVRGRR